MKEKNISNVTIDAHGDGEQSSESELALAELRADNLKGLLDKKCSYTFRSTTISYGEERPISRGNEKKSGVSIKFD